MKTTNKSTIGKLLAVVIALIVAIGVLCGGVLSVMAENTHTHSFSEEWTAGYKNHWHAATCGCPDLAGDMAPHTFENGVCTVCNEQKAANPAHVHTFKTEWKSDDNNHWHEALCEHNIVKDIAEHTLNGNTCTVCGKVVSVETDPGTKPGTEPVDPPTTPVGPAKPAELPEGLDDAGGYNESLYAEWTASNGSVSGVEAAYKVVGTTTWTPIDKELIRVSGTTARVDAVGLKAGKYNLKITANGKTMELGDNNAITVTQYDRSGYAHFKYTDGVGAYKDDGTLKDNALVIYVTDENKDTVMKDVVAANSDLKMFKIPYSGQGKDWGGKDAESIGWWLNNAQYTMNNENSDKNKRPSNTYDAANGGKYGFKIDRPIAIRFLGTVTAPEGVTAYNSEDEGGTVKDNGFMVRMKNYKNLTIEGIGEDATVEGWGFHFMAGTDAVSGQGKSFEVRNLTFDKYPEDAIGMEGQATSTKITGPVERCWVHNNVFLPGYCAKPTENDKAEGDGSCDFKRGEYFTLSYNYFTDCHKTNLLGSSDSSLQFNITMHHNWWHNCGSRMPLTRQANVHFYNNYCYVNPATAPAGLDISYVSALRANCLLFSENNYYDGSKNITQKKDGMGIAYGNTYYATSGENALQELSARDERISGSKCAYNGTSYADFYINPNTFYYDAANKKSNCLIDDSVTARKRVMMFAGVNGFGKKEAETNINEYEPEKAVSVPDNSTLTVDLSKIARGNSVVSNIVFTGITGNSSGVIKGKGQIVTFTLAVDTHVEITASSGKSDIGNGELVRADGTSFGHDFGTFSGTLPAGTYFIASSQKDKELNISKISFTDSGNSSELRVQAAKEAIGAIGEVTLESGSLITAANKAYNALNANEKASFDANLKAKLDKANTDYESLLINNVVALINAIGTVNKDSYNAINAAQTAYDKLTVEQQKLVSKADYDKLTAAQTAYAQFAVNNVIDQIEALTDVSKIGVSDKTAIENARQAYDTAKSAYDKLDDGNEEGETNQQALVTNYSKLADGLKILDQLEKLFEFRDMLDGMSASTVTVSSGAALKSAYESLSLDQENALTADEKTAYADIIKAYNKLASQSESLSFTENTTGYKNSKFTVNGKTTSGSVTVGDVTYTVGLKMESSTSIKFNVSVKMTLTMYFGTACAGKKVKIDGTSYTVDSNGVLTVEIEAGDHTITKDTTNTNLFYLTLTPAA